MRIEAPLLPLHSAADLSLREAAPRPQKETPEQSASGARDQRALVPLERAGLPSVTTIDVVDAEVVRETEGRTDGRPDVRNISPRAITELSSDLYVSGIISYEEHALLAYQPELQPDYDETIGALTGQKAEPDRPRDFVAHWEERLNFEIAHNGDNATLIDRTERILAVLRQIDRPTDFLV